jgi:hypothetical protein
MKKTLAGIILLFSAFILKGQDVKVTSAFDSTRILIGDQIHFTITIDQPSDINLKLQGFKDTLVKNIEVLKGPQIDTSVLGSGKIRVTEKYLVTSFDSGYYHVNPVYAEAKTADGLKRFYSDYAKLGVAKYRISPADSAARIYDIINPYKAPLTFRDVIPWVLLGLIAAALIWGIIRFIKNRKNVKTEKEVVVNPDPAHVIAFRELEKLKAEELWQKGHIKAYYTRLTEILRQYLENRYNVYSLEMTTSETLYALLKTGFKKDESFTTLKTVLTTADLVKFAKYVPDNDENEASFLKAWNFVDVTKPAEPAPLENGGMNEERKEEKK